MCRYRCIWKRQHTQYDLHSVHFMWLMLQRRVTKLLFVSQVTAEICVGVCVGVCE